MLPQSYISFSFIFEVNLHSCGFKLASANKTPIYNFVVKEYTTAVQKPISLQVWGLPVPIFHQNLLTLHLQSTQWRQLVPLKHWSAPTHYNTMSQTKIQYEILSYNYCFIIKLLTGKNNIFSLHLTHLRVSLYWQDPALVLHLSFSSSFSLSSSSVKELRWKSAPCWYRYTGAAVFVVWVCYGARWERRHSVVGMLHLVNVALLH